MAETSLPPGPRLPALLQVGMVMASPYGWMTRRARRYGDCFSSRFPFYGRVVYLAEPSLVKELFGGDSETFHSGEATATMLGPVLGNYSLLTLDEGEHMRQRKLLLPPFHGEAIRRYEELIEAIAEREVATWPVGEQIELRPRMQAITLDVILRAVFGIRGEERMDLYRERIPRLADASTLLIFGPALRRNLGRFSPYARFARAMQAVDELIYEEIAERREAPDAEERDDMLSLLLSARHEDGGPMSDQELRDELMTLVTAGHETTATGLSWALERLMRTPEVMERLLDSLGSDSDEYLDATVKETLRARPVVTDVARKLTRDTEVGGYRLPAGTFVVAAIAAVHARADVYPEPERFRPERWLDGAGESYGWIPFGGGVRRCIGASFAQLEMKLVLRTVLSRVRLSAPSKRPERPRVKHVTAVPSRGARALVEERLAADDHEQLGARGDGGVVAADAAH
jgi:cytochrome P450